MPVFFARRNPDHVAGPDLADRSALGLHPADAGDHVQRLAERMGMPVGPRARLERDALQASRAGARAAMIGSCQTVPKKYAWARRVGREPARWISMGYLSLLMIASSLLVFSLNYFFDAS